MDEMPSAGGSSLRRNGVAMFTTGLVGLKFLLEDGHYLALALKQAEATEILKGWRDGLLKPIIGGTSENSSPFESCAWAIKTDKIKGIHTFNLASLARPDVGMGLAPPGHGSGLPYN